MKWSNVWLILDREVRDQLRDRRTLFMIGVLPLILYPLLGVAMLQVAQFMREYPTRVLVLGAESLPVAPPLIVIEEGQKPRFADHLGDDGQTKKIELTLPESKELPADPTAYAREVIDQGEFDAVMLIPPDFRQRIEQYRRGLRPGAEDEPGGAKPHSAIAPPQIFYNVAREKSKIAHTRLSHVISDWRDRLVQSSFESSHIPVAAARPFELDQQNIAEEQESRAAIWSKILPFIVMIWALTGAFYPAIDLCAGEKERGTLETLLSSPAERSEIVYGKLGTVIVFSMATALLNLFSMTVTGGLVFRQFQAMGTIPPGLAVGPPPLAAVPWLILALIPISALFSALSLAIAAMARSTREGQYYLMPLLLSAMPLMMLPMLPAMELDLGTSLIPLTGVMLLLRSLIEGQSLEALRYAVPVVGVTLVCVLLAVRWAIDQFNNEDVLFRESERFDLQAWILHMVRERGDTPSVAEAIFAALVLLLIRFAGSLWMTQMPTSWNGLVQMILVTQLALILTPILLMALILTRSPSKTLLLRMPAPATLLGAGLLAVALHPFALLSSQIIKQIYPPSPGVEVLSEKLTALFDQAPSFWLVLGMFALVPAICEELACRGFILSGLRHSGHRWLAIAGSAVVFGLIHAVLQQQLNAALFGLVLGYIALKTESIAPAMLFHFVHNALGMSIGFLPGLVREQPWLATFVEASDKEVSYRWPTLVICGLAAAAILWWFKSLPYHLTEEEELEEARDREPEASREEQKTERESGVLV